MLENILTILPYLILILYCMFSLTLVSKLKYSKKKTIFILIPFTLILTAINLFIFYYYGKDSFRNLFTLTVFIPESIMISFISKRKGFSLITSILNAYITFYILFLTVSALSFKMTNIFQELFIYIVAIPFLFVYLYRFYSHAHDEIEETIPKFFRFLLVYAALMFIEITIYQIMINAIEKAHVLRLEIFGVAILSVYILSIIFISYLVNKYKIQYSKIRDQEWIEMHIQNTLNQIKVGETKEKELRIIRHDVRHILTTVSSLIVDKPDEAISFINQYITALDNTRRVVFCSDTLINSAIEYYYFLCMDNNIKLNCKINNIEDALNIPSHEVALLLSNCLENAYNATLKLENDRVINLVFLNNDGRLALKVENNYIGSITLNDDNTPVNHDENHGVGTQSIKYFVERNDLIADYNITDNKFVLNILFK